MRRLLPHPYMSASLFLMWMLMNESVSPGPALLGLAFALLGGWALAMLQPLPLRIRRWGTALRLAGVVAVDIARSNLGVALVILHPRADRRQGFIRIPLALRNDTALATLACILTATPGTAWVEFDRESGVLLLHVLDLIDEESWVRIVKGRYEQPLMEIFQ
ncbi:putative monovalent cation/H+ antiporter subunit E [Acetobacteraceae bacterium AT-5844]|nr:putative monovalent cation/H+ antiporter subunit E [Acetobacteraceae bacterium AT-5844]